MIDIQKTLIKAMKNELFKDELIHLNILARSILGELKTKLKDYAGEVTAEVQYKLLSKMKKDRENTVGIFKEAYEKTKSEIAKSNLDKAIDELIPLNKFLEELETELPKQLSEEEIKTIIKDIVEKANGTIKNIGQIMKEFKGRTDVDMSVVSKLAKEFLL